MSLPYIAPHPEGVTVEIWIQPNAKKSCIVGTHGNALKVKISSPAVDGKANAALIAFLAKALKIRENQIALISGLKNRQKVLLITGLTLVALTDLFRHLMAAPSS